MARKESDREDLLREAVALVERVELTATDGTPIVIGFRANGCASFYFGAEPVYHFNALNELRRAHHDGQLFKAEQRQLVAMSRRRAADEVQLVRHLCTEDETVAFLADAAQRLDKLSTLLAGDTLEIVGQVPAEGDILDRVRGWLTDLPRPIALARSPHAR